jgi:hypothetical protein
MPTPGQFFPFPLMLSGSGVLAAKADTALTMSLGAVVAENTRPIRACHKAPRPLN